MTVALPLQIALSSYRVIHLPHQASQWSCQQHCSRHPLSNPSDSQRPYQSRPRPRKRAPRVAEAITRSACQRKTGFSTKGERPTGPKGYQRSKPRRELGVIGEHTQRHRRMSRARLERIQTAGHGASRRWRSSKVVKTIQEVIGIRWFKSIKGRRVEL